MRARLLEELPLPVLTTPHSSLCFVQLLTTFDLDFGGKASLSLAAILSNFRNNGITSGNAYPWRRPKNPDERSPLPPNTELEPNVVKWIPDSVVWGKGETRVKNLPDHLGNLRAHRCRFC